jgi:geranylgeranyl diphosphate synthase type II
MDYLNELKRSRLLRAFTEFMPLPCALEPHLRRALEQLLSNAGSLIRPEIVLDVAMAYGLSETAALDMAVALEYFHTASLVFDDLPAMDDADQRRGKACVHLEFGDAGAMLAALALINRAYALTWKAVGTGETFRQARALDYVEKHLGVEGLLNGQSMDLHYASLPKTRQTTDQTAIGKTVSLIRLTLVLPALVGGASEVELRLLERIALFWGLSYQTADDLKDVLQSSGESGKTAARDLSLGRPNIALVLGVTQAVQRLRRLIALGDRTLEHLMQIKPEVSFLRKLRAQLGEEAHALTEGVHASVVGGSA